MAWLNKRFAEETERADQQREFEEESYVFDKLGWDETALERARMKGSVRKAWYRNPDGSRGAQVPKV